MGARKGKHSMTAPGNQRPADTEYQARIAASFESATGTLAEKLAGFPRFVPMTDLGRFLARAWIFERILGVHGSIVECGVHLGGGLMTWTKLSAILEPLNHVRKVVGFDSFAGFTAINAKDVDGAKDNPHLKRGGLAADVQAELSRDIADFDAVRPLGHIPKTSLVAGDACETLPRFLADNPHFVCALLYLDFDLYQPTRVALEGFLPRMPKGAVIVFDELNIEQWPGETMAVLDTVGLRALRLERFPHQPQISFAVLD
jgi:hypothetical protein